jgi:signal transduction histidine kinase
MDVPVNASGWLLALAAAARVVVLRRRLELVARAEHELRGPLTTLILALPRGVRLDSELARVRLGLADLAAARSGRRAAPRRKPVRLDQLARSVNGARVDWNAGPSLIHADPERLSQALGNLVANAHEHGQAPVVIKAERRGRAVRLEVTDAGRGLRGRGLGIAAAAARDSGGELRISRRGFPAIDLPADGG